ncbi:MAG: arsenate reductase ArsC [Syntrophomonadaceae bacterium]|nr:arsenate reductase ArsC [Syntrophomonadaceae bacterium]
MRNPKEKVIFICTQNSARSQMAEGLLRNMYGDFFDVYSAGTSPSRVNPFAVKAMADINIDMSAHRSKSIEEFKNEVFDYAITVCDKAHESCLFFPGDR